MTIAREPLPPLNDYAQPSRWYDEVVDADGTIRPAAGGVRGVVEWLAGAFLP